MSLDCKTPEDVLKAIADHNVRIVDVRITDLPGIWQHFSVPARAVDADTFSDGIGFDGSSIRGFQEIHESDMLVIPDPTTAFLDPFTEVPTLILICNVRDPVTGQAYSRDARYIAQKAEAYLKSSGIGETAYFGPEAEFFVFDDVRYGQGTNFGFYEVDSAEGNWNSGAEQNPNLGHKPRPKEGYFPVPPSDSQQDLRTEMVLTLEDIGIAVEAHHHEVATGGQAEIDMRFDALTRMADNLMIYKYVVKNVARARGMTATFMPKPLFDDNGSGMRRPPEHLERRYAAVLRRGRLRRAEPDGPLLHRRPVEAHRGAVRHRRPDHQLVPPTAWCRDRGADQPGLLTAQPLGLLPHSDVLAGPEGEAGGVPHAGSVDQRLSRLRRPVDGGPRRDREPHRSGRAHR